MSSYIFYPLAVLAVLIVMKLFSLPVKWLGKLILNALVGVVLLAVLYYLEPYTGISMGINGLTVGVSAVLGVPGIILLLMIRWVFMM